MLNIDRCVWEMAMPMRLAFLRVWQLVLSTTAFALLAVSLTIGCMLSVAVSKADQLYGAPPNNLKEYLERLARYYSETISRFDDDFLYLRNGTKFAISDHRADKTFQELLEQPDIANMFYAQYPVGTIPKQPETNMDPGRVRFEPLFVAMYGDCKKNEVINNMRAIKWLPKHGGGSVTITRINGVDKALDDVSRDLDELPSDLIKYLKPTAGTYNCRAVAGANYMSMHAYAAAIDINAKYSNYWRWALNDRGEPKWANQIPIQIVRIFEKHGFIWGGYWYHYDTMHFEFRPELLPSVEPAG
jgi:hypothetical protein